MNRHELEPLPLIVGILFLGLASGFLLDELDVWSADVTWIGPVTLIVAGLAGVLSALLRRDRDEATHAS